MNFSEKDFKLVENTILDGKKFNDNQKEFIQLLGSKYIIAGPGVGKTTCLVAKIVLLLMGITSENSKEAICIITQTNVAVDEINRILRMLGLSHINHPHFIGTVHQFFNTFLAIPYIKKHLNPQNLRFADEEDYSTLISVLVHKSSYFGKWSEGAKTSVIKRIKESNLIYDLKTNKINLENSSAWDKFDKHQLHMFNIKWELKRLGFFTFNDTFLFAEAALGYEKNISILRKRFKYVFIDEFQDTKASNIKILKKIFLSEGNIIQFVGDPNQTLDFYGQMPEVDYNNVFELKVCNRFGEKIARQLPNIINGVNLECLKENESFDPLLIIYNANKELIPFYKKIFLEFLALEGFLKSDRKDSILSLRKKAINEYNSSSDQEVSEYKISRSESFTNHIIKLINELILKKMSLVGEFNFDLKQWIKDHPEQLGIKKCLIESVKAGKLEKETLKVKINTILKEENSGVINSSNEIFNKIVSVIKLIKNSYEATEVIKNENGNFLYSTIHAAKGETHRSVLLIDSDESEIIHTRMLKSFYCKDDISYADEWVARNLLYVAMSRPTHLFAFGINNKNISKEEIQIFKDKGWDIRYTFDVTE
ncbi:MAG: UvrD-helicase domain-containing protein [Paenibacillaceae bacterium]